jgi:hypothetical protein
VTIVLHDGAASFVTGYGIPYANGKDYDLEGIVNQDEPIIDGITLKDLLAMNKFSLVVAANTSAINKLNEQHLPAHFTYPYGDDHAYDLNNYRMIFSRTKSKKQFLPAFAFDDLNSFLAVSVQAVIQDFLWLHARPRECPTPASLRTSSHARRRRHHLSSSSYSPTCVSSASSMTLLGGGSPARRASRCFSLVPRADADLSDGELTQHTLVTENI